MKTYTITINDKQYEVKGCEYCGCAPSSTTKHHAAIYCSNENCRLQCVSFPCLCEDDGNCPEIENAIKEWNTRALKQESAMDYKTAFYRTHNELAWLKLQLKYFADTLRESPNVSKESIAKQMDHVATKVADVDFYEAKIERASNENLQN